MIKLIAMGGGVDPTADKATANVVGPAAADGPHDPASPAQPGSDGMAGDEHWSPWGTAYARWSWGLLAIFVAIYFAVAILTSKEFADLAATMVFGLPLGFILGVGMIVSGLIVTRIYLAKVDG